MACFFVVVCACCCNVKLLSLSPISSPYPIQRPSHSPFVRRFGQGKRNWAQIICVLSPCQCCAPPPPFHHLAKGATDASPVNPNPPQRQGVCEKKPSVPFHDREQNPYGKSIHSLFFVWHTHTHGLTVRDFLFHTLSQPDNGNKHGTGTAVSWRRRRWHWWFCSKLELYHCFTAHMHRHTHVQTHIHTLETGTGVEIDCFCCVRLRLLYCWAAGKLAAFPL